MGAGRWALGVESAHRVEVDTDGVLEVGGHDLERHGSAEAAHHGVWDEG